MKREHAAKIWRIVKAYGEGKKIQVYSDQEWISGDNVDFHWLPAEYYRIAPTKKTVWVNVYKDSRLGAAYHSTKEEAEKIVLCVEGCNYIGTYPMEIEVPE